MMRNGEMKCLEIQSCIEGWAVFGFGLQDLNLSSPGLIGLSRTSDKYSKFCRVKREDFREY